VNEPATTILAYRIDQKPTDQIVLIYDFEGRSVEVSLLDISDGTIETLATAHDVRLGSNDLDQRVANHLLEIFKSRMVIYPFGDHIALSRLRAEVQRAKHTLSDEQVALVRVEAFHNGEDMSEVVARN
jgi:heat shock protein 5